MIFTEQEIKDLLTGFGKQVQNIERVYLNGNRLAKELTSGKIIMFGQLVVNVPYMKLSTPNANNINTLHSYAFGIAQQCLFTATTILDTLVVPNVLFDDIKSFSQGTAETIGSLVYPSADPLVAQNSTLGISIIKGNLAGTSYLAYPAISFTGYKISYA